MGRTDGISRRQLGGAGLLLATSLAMPALQAQPRPKLERTWPSVAKHHSAIYP